MRVLVGFLALSLVLHALLLLGGIMWKPAHLQALKRQQPVEVVYTKDSKKQPPDTSKDKTFVKQVNVPENLKFEDPNEAQFSSEVRQRVIQEMRARESGVTKNRDQGPKFLQEDLKQQIAKEREKQKSEDGWQVFNPKQELKQRFEAGESTISVKLPDNIAVGSLTALNTDRNIYYSFYSRLEDMIYLRWADLIGKAVDSYPADFKRRKLVGRAWKTNVVILLRPNGEFHRAEIHNQSGVEKFDLSPILAFQDARVFPNPPPEMVRSDGFIHISYSFVVDFGRVQ